VLVVEHDVELAAYVKRGLERDGYGVDMAWDGEEGVGLALTETYVAIVLDAALPDVSGYTACEQLRRQGCWVPIIILSASDDAADHTRALGTGADDALPRHFANADLHTRLRSVIRRREGKRPSPLQVGDLDLDPIERRVRVGDVPVQLTPTEFCVLEHFMRRAGETISKQETLDACWSWGYRGEPNIVEVYVGLLRRKLDAPSGRAHIQTVRGSGYRLVVDVRE
jgi:DNA-binding response OmpR family regulator